MRQVVSECLLENLQDPFLPIPQVKAPRTPTQLSQDVGRNNLVPGPCQTGRTSPSLLHLEYIIHMNYYSHHYPLPPSVKRDTHASAKYCKNLKVNKQPTLSKMRMPLPRCLLQAVQKLLFISFNIIVLDNLPPPRGKRTCRPFSPRQHCMKAFPI